MQDPQDFSVLHSNPSLKDSAYSTKGVEDEKLRTVIAAIREAIQERGKVVEWKPKEFQIADVLAKQGDDDKFLLKALKERHL